MEVYFNLNGHKPANIYRVFKVNCAQVSTRWREKIKHRMTRSSGRVLTSLLIAYMCDVFPEKQYVDISPVQSPG